MSTWSSRIENGYVKCVNFFVSPAGRYVLTSLLTTATLLSAQHVQRIRHRRALQRDVAEHLRTDEDDLLNSVGMPIGHEEETGPVEFDDSLIKEFLARNYAFLGHDNCTTVRNAFVVVVGLGGVGSTAATMLVRSGVGRIRIIDFDQITLSSLNRHACATLADVGIAKVQACKRFFNRIAPWIQVDARNDLWRLEDANALLSGKPDWVVDAIDNIGTKVQLLKYCKENNIKVISSMGAASKTDPSRIQIADISATYEDPLARSLRRRLKIEGIMSGIPVVYSTEKPNSQTALLPLDEEEFQRGAVSELSALEDFRVRILPCLGPLPAIFGQAIAVYVVASLGKARLEPLAVKGRPKTYWKARQNLVGIEARLTGATNVDLSLEDIEYLIDDLFRGRSCVGPAFKIPAHPTLCRWREEAPLSTSNCVLFDRDEAERHVKFCLAGSEDPETYWGIETTDLVDKRAAEDRALRKWRL